MSGAVAGVTGAGYGGQPTPPGAAGAAGRTPPVSNASGAAGAPAAPGEGGGAGAGGTDPSAVVGTYDLAFAQPVPEEPAICGAPAWDGEHAQLRLWEDSGQLRATLTPEWGEPSTTDAVLDVSSGLLVIRWDALVEAPTLRWDAGDNWTFTRDSLLQLSISVASGSLADSAEAQFESECSDCDAIASNLASGAVTVTPDRTRPRLRLHDMGELGAFLPFVPFEVTTSEPIPGLEDRIVVSAEGASQAAPLTTVQPDPLQLRFVDWDSVSGTTQRVALREPFVDDSGNSSGLMSLSLVVLALDTPLVGSDIDVPVSTALWGDASLISATDDPVLCEQSSCVVLGPDTTATDGLYSWVAGTVAASGAERLRIRYRAFADDEIEYLELPEPSLRVSVWYLDRDGIEERNWYQAEEEFALESWSDPIDPTMVYATEWLWMEVPLDGSESDAGFVIVNEEMQDWHCGRSRARVIIDRVVVE